MTVLDPLTEPLVRLFVRIDAAHPTDALLLRIADFWQDKRGGNLAPGQDEMNRLPVPLLSNAFAARLTSNGTHHWLACNPGAAARSILKVKDGEPIEASDKRNAVRLRRLFGLVAEKAEPYAAMFEMRERGGKTRLIEVFAAPLSGADKASHLIFAAVNSRIEAK